MFIVSCILVAIYIATMLYVFTDLFVKPKTKKK